MQSSTKNASLAGPTVAKKLKQALPSPVGFLFDKKYKENNVRQTQKELLMNILKIFQRPSPAEIAERIGYLKHKLTEVRAGRYLIKPSDRATNLSELEKKLEKEITGLGG